MQFKNKCYFAFRGPMRIRESISDEYPDEEKSFFKKYGCSHFFMSREEPERYERYRALRIPESVEQKWLQESLSELAQRTVAMTQSREIAQAHSSLVRFASDAQQPEAVTLIANVTQAVAGKLTTPMGNLRVAENLIGRTSDKHDGAIFLAYHLGLHKLAQEFINVALTLVSNAESQRQHLERCASARRDTHQLATRLSLACKPLPDAAAHAIVYMIGPNREEKLVDPTSDELAARIQSLQWTKNSSVTLQRLPARQLSIDRIIIEKKFIPDSETATERFDVSWCHAKDECYWIRACVDSLDSATEILAAAINNNEAKLRAAANWNWPPALNPK